MEGWNLDLHSASNPVFLRRVNNAINMNFFSNTLRDSVLFDDDSNDGIITRNGDPLLSQYDQSDLDLRTLFGSTDPSRNWVFDVLQDSYTDTITDTAVSDESEIRGVMAAFRAVTREATPEGVMPNQMYYGVGLLSTTDKYPEIIKMPVRVVRASEHTQRKPSVVHLTPALQRYANRPSTSNTTTAVPRVRQPNTAVEHTFALPRPVSRRKRTKKFKDEESKKKWEDVMTIKRRKLFTSIVKKEVGKQHRAKINKHKELLLQCKRVSLQCQKVVRQRALQSARVVKEQQWRIKKLSRENLAYWKLSKRVDREMRRKLEKEAEEQRKIDFEFLEIKRQQRKLNFLITQTELYAHFMSRKLGTGTPEEQLRILNQLDEEKIPRLENIDDYDCNAMKAQALRNVQDAINEDARKKNCEMGISSVIQVKNIVPTDGEHVQPKLFCGHLKGYQLRGMNWLANLYNQGISGILADEMGLGKTVQSIAFLCHIAETHDVWGPFLVISPTSTLHNWQQEVEKFVPEFKVVPYWGSPNVLGGDVVRSIPLKGLGEINV